MPAEASCARTRARNRSGTSVRAAISRPLIGRPPSTARRISARIAYSDSRFSSRRIARLPCGFSRGKETPSGCVFQEPTGPGRRAKWPLLRSSRQSLRRLPKLEEGHREDDVDERQEGAL